MRSSGWGETNENHAAHGVGGSYCQLVFFILDRISYRKMGPLTSTEAVDREEVGVHDVTGAGGLQDNSIVSFLFCLKCN